MSRDYDAIVIGARCGGAPTAMLLARSGHRVLLVDKATFPSDTLSTHLIHPPGVAALERWGILDTLKATGCPPISRYIFDFGPIKIDGSARPIDGNATSYGPRRTVLDALLVDAAVAAGAELREAFAVEEILMEDGRVTGIRGHEKGGPSVTEHARVVIGADGKNSMVAKAVDASRYNEVPALETAYYAYWSGLPVDGFEIFDRGEHHRGGAALPTNDGLTCVIAGWPRREFEANRKDFEGSYMAVFDLVPEFAERLRDAKRETRFAASGVLPNFFRKPYGPGWVLVGDAGCHRDPITAFGITDAFRDAELVAAALDDVFAGRNEYDQAMAHFQRTRDEASMPMYELTMEIAKLEPAPPEMQQLAGAVHADKQASDDWVSVMAGTLPAPEFFAPDNVGRIMAQAGAPAG